MRVDILVHLYHFITHKFLSSVFIYMYNIKLSATESCWDHYNTYVHYKKFMLSNRLFRIRAALLPSLLITRGACHPDVSFLRHLWNILITWSFSTLKLWFINSNGVFPSKSFIEMASGLHWIRFSTICGLHLRLTHSQWRGTRPYSSTCLEASGYELRTAHTTSKVASYSHAQCRAKRLQESGENEASGPSLRSNFTISNDAQLQHAWIKGTLPFSSFMRNESGKESINSFTKLTSFGRRSHAKWIGSRFHHNRSLPCKFGLLYIKIKEQIAQCQIIDFDYQTSNIAYLQNYTQ